MPFPVLLHCVVTDSRRDLQMPVSLANSCILLPISFCTQVVAKCLPFYVSPDLASTVLFVGRAVRVLRRPAGGAGGGGRELLPLHDMMQFAQVGMI